MSEQDDVPKQEQPKEEKLDDKEFSSEVAAVPQYKMELPDQGHKENLYDMGQMIDAEYQDLYDRVAQIALDDAKAESAHEAQRGYMAAMVLQMEEAARARLEKLEADKIAAGEFEKGAKEKSDAAIGEYFKKPMQQAGVRGGVGSSRTVPVGGKAIDSSGGVDVPQGWGEVVYLSNKSERPFVVKEIDEFKRLNEPIYVAPGYVQRHPRSGDVSDKAAIFRHPAAFKIKLTMAIIIGILVAMFMVLSGYILWFYVLRKK